MTRMWEQVRDWVLVGSLLLISVFVLLTSNEPMLRGLRARSLEVTSSVENLFSGLGRYVRALEENEALRTQNVELSNSVALMRASQLENERLHELLALSDSSSSDMVAARVISKDITRERNTFVLDVGTEDGIETDMAVIDSRGVIGKIVFVSEHYSKVMTYLNADFFAPVMVYPSNSDGIVSWDGTRFDRLIVNHIVLSASIQSGDPVVTSGQSAIFQKGYPVGIVDSIFAESGVSTWTIFVTPSAPLDDASHVFVVKTRPDLELIGIIK
jgi:rod shape-determining protein MreC